MLKVAMLSYWHVHSWDYTKQAQAHPETEIAAVWDEEPERGRAAADKLGVPFYESLDEVLKAPGIDAVIVDAPTNLHRDVMVAAAQAGKHIFTEKVVAPTLQEAEEILKAVEQNGVVLTVSLPRLNDGYTLTIQDILKEGWLGQLTLVRVRLSHNGATKDWLPVQFYNAEQCLGGALIDLGCHPMYLTRLFLGEPESVTARYGYLTGKAVEDNAVAVLSYANGALGIVEAGFVNSHSPFTIEIHGLDGTLMYGTPDNRLLLRTDRNPEYADGWHAIPLKENRSSAYQQWVEHIRTNTKAVQNVELALELTRLMEASNLSAKENRAVRLSELQG